MREVVSDRNAHIKGISFRTLIQMEYRENLSVLIFYSSQNNETGLFAVSPFWKCNLTKTPNCPKNQPHVRLSENLFYIDFDIQYTYIYNL